MSWWQDKALLEKACVTTAREAVLQSEVSQLQETLKQQQQQVKVLTHQCQHQSRFSLNLEITTRREQIGAQ